jgi:hypothetical protein
MKALDATDFPKTDEEAKEYIPPGEQWAVVYEPCRQSGKSIAESMLVVFNSKERIAEL